ncbi:ornithine cyclodeaminase family protein [Streptomyces sp. NBC_00083]|uniref:ornithine cyclodeaminase family protein n=1 Tax=Streptomyces sp. NBC_00083 TaxID=2975647 RepID=UPI002251AD1A|nr:ornithine cyclodeaminase family protein [Streptomyces sp. NBC_00083]MCX5387302.1 ornithine cyclodeaminase family protein [Streptomyces sp. NBC_00083]
MTAAGPTQDPVAAPAPAPGSAPASDGPLAARRLLYLTEEQTAAYVDEELALEAARAAFAATVDSEVFTSLAVHGSDPRNRFTLKPSASATHAGVKIGTYWPDNEEHGLPRHHSTLLLLDQTVGRIAAVLEVGTANAYRTAAADALAVDLLARADATTLAVFGTGHQAAYEVAAVSRVRAIGEVLVVGRTVERAERMAAALVAQGHNARAAGAEEACGRADVIVTATTARADTPPLFEAAWVRPGTHLSCMGADAPGKRELPPQLFDRARVFCDLPEQARRMGESQHAPDGTVLTPLGDVLTHRAAGRADADDITVFDSSGIGLQDLYLGLALLKKMDISL